MNYGLSIPTLIETNFLADELYYLARNKNEDCMPMIWRDSTSRLEGWSRVKKSSIRETSAKEIKEYQRQFEQACIDTTWETNVAVGEKKEEFKGVSFGNFKKSPGMKTLFSNFGICGSRNHRVRVPLMKKSDKAVARLRQGTQRTPGGWVWIPSGILKLKEPIFHIARQSANYSIVNEEPLTGPAGRFYLSKTVEPTLPVNTGRTFGSMRYLLRCWETQDPLKALLNRLPNELIIIIRWYVGDVLFDRSYRIVRGKGEGGLIPRQLAG
jgi:hypothetical protein